jgi:hypothetical protein
MKVIVLSHLRPIVWGSQVRTALNAEKDSSSHWFFSNPEYRFIKRKTALVSFSASQPHRSVLTRPTVFHTGNEVNILISGIAVGGWLLLKYHYVRLNRRNERLWAAMTEKERLEEESLALSKGNKSVLFRFRT